MTLTPLLTKSRSGIHRVSIKCQSGVYRDVDKVLTLRCPSSVDRDDDQEFIEGRSRVSINT